jgi:hypothetical protein
MLSRRIEVISMHELLMHARYIVLLACLVINKDRSVMNLADQRFLPSHHFMLTYSLPIYILLCNQAFLF